MQGARCLPESKEDMRISCEQAQVRSSSRLPSGPSLHFGPFPFGILPVHGELQNWPKATWSNNVTEGNGRLVFKRDLEFANGQVSAEWSAQTLSANNGESWLRRILTEP